MKTIRRQEYTQYSRMLYPACLRILANAEESEEAMHDALLDYLCFTGSFDSEAQRKSWLYKVAISKSIDRLRRRHRQLFNEEAVQMEEAQLSFFEDDELLWQDDWAVQEMQGNDISRLVHRIKESMLLLAPGYRTVLSLFLFEGYDFDEISDILSVRPATVRSQYVRGRAKLRELLKENVKD